MLALSVTLFVVLGQLPETLVCPGGEKATAALCALEGFSTIAWNDKDWAALSRFARRNSKDEADDLALIYLATHERFFPGLAGALTRQLARLKKRPEARQDALKNLLLRAVMPALERGGGQPRPAPPPQMLLSLVDQLSADEGQRRHALMSAVWALVHANARVPEDLSRRLVESSQRGDSLALCALYTRGVAYQAAKQPRQALEMFQEAGQIEVDPAATNWLDCRGLAEVRLRDLEASLR